MTEAEDREKYAGHTIYTQFAREMVVGTSVVAAWVHWCFQCNEMHFGGSPGLLCAGYANYVEVPGQWSSESHRSKVAEFLDSNGSEERT